MRGGWSGTSSRGTPPMKVGAADDGAYPSRRPSAARWRTSGCSSTCPSTATNTCARRISPLAGSTTRTVWPAQRRCSSRPVHRPPPPARYPSHSNCSVTPRALEILVQRRVVGLLPVRAARAPRRVQPRLQFVAAQRAGPQPQLCPPSCVPVAPQAYQQRPGAEKMHDPKATPHALK